MEEGQENNRVCLEKVEEYKKSLHEGIVILTGNEMNIDLQCTEVNHITNYRTHPQYTYSVIIKLQKGYNWILWTKKGWRGIGMGEKWEGKQLMARIKPTQGMYIKHYILSERSNGTQYEHTQCNQDTVDEDKIQEFPSSLLLIESNSPPRLWNVAQLALGTHFKRKFADKYEIDKNRIQVTKTHLKVRSQPNKLHESHEQAK
jgi:hypothetical protein